MKAVYTVAFSMFLYLASPVIAMELIAPDLTGLVSKDGKGAYQMIVKEATRRAGVDYSESFYPVKRAVKTFVDNQNACMYCLVDLAAEAVGKDNIVESFPFGVFKMHIFTPKGAPVVTDISQLKGKRLGAIRGYEDWYEKTGVMALKPDMAGNDVTLLNMMNNERLDAIISFMPDFRPHLDQVDYAPGHPLLTSYDSMVCHNNPKGKQFIEKISLVLEEMKNDGTMKKILGDYYLGE